MRAHRDISYLGVVRNVIGYGKERIGTVFGIAVKDLLQILVRRHVVPVGIFLGKVLEKKVGKFPSAHHRA
jgi:hypothetical protein